MSDRGNRLLRTLDRIYGIPLIIFLGFFVRKKRAPQHFNRVGILATAAIGDTLLISAVLKDLIKARPGSKLTVFCGKSNEGTFKMLFPSHPAVKLKVIPVGNPLKAIGIIRKDKFDIWLDFGPWPRINSLLSFYARSPFKIGFKSIKQYRHYIYNQAVEHRNDCHEIDNLRRILSPFSIEAKSIPSLGKPEPDKSNPYIVVHMFPSGFMAHYKEWSDSNWVILLEELVKAGKKIKLTGAPKDLEASERITALCKDISSIEILAGKTNLNQVANVVQKAELVISVNTGIMHMAAAFNQKLIALHGPTSVLRWGPLCNNPVNFSATSPSAGCLHLGFEYDKKDNHSMDTIDPKEVLKKALSLLPS